MTMTSIGQQVEQLASKVKCDSLTRLKPCSNTGRYVFACHVLDKCRSGPYTPEGDFVRVLCESCTETAFKMVADKFANLVGLMKPGVWPSCETCGKTFKRLADFVSVEHVCQHAG